MVVEIFKTSKNSDDVSKFLGDKKCKGLRCKGKV